MRFNNENIILITLDSCRWDSFDLSEAKELKAYGSFRKAYSQGTYTLPSHISIFSGILPNASTNEPLYNRFVKDLFRIDQRPTPVAPLILLPKNSYNIVTAFQKMEYYTFGFGAVSWFKHPMLNNVFDDFLFTGIHLNKQIELSLQKIRELKRNFFCFINIGETHEPFEYGEEMISESSTLRDKMRNFENVGFLYTEFQKQIDCINFISKKLDYFFTEIKKLNKKSLVIICGDHGECFGEDGKYGHGFYHEKTIEVPLGVFKI